MRSEINKILSIFIILFGFTIIVLPQTSDLILESGVKPHKEIDAIYEAFTKGYRDLNVNLVTNLYTEDANYLAPGKEMTDGKEKIREGFASFFDIKLGFEVGIYTINTFKDGKQIGSGQGKFLVVTKKIGDKWFFRFDGYSNLPKLQNN